MSIIAGLLTAFLFFFSSRRRHTRFDCDWSSDVCSSDLNKIAWKDACRLMGPAPIVKRGANVPGEARQAHLIDQGVGGVQMADVSVDVEKIGRASCRERV